MTIITSVFCMLKNHHLRLTVLLLAFAVLLMNLAAPTIDYYTRPRTYGHRKAERGFKLGE